SAPVPDTFTPGTATPINPSLADAVAVIGNQVDAVVDSLRDAITAMPALIPTGA
ncbi:hypothetical protein NSK11_contig00005-0001, partial [Nocardia seriolae]